MGEGTQRDGCLSVGGSVLSQTQILEEDAGQVDERNNLFCVSNGILLHYNTEITRLKYAEPTMREY